VPQFPPSTEDWGSSKALPWEPGLVCPFISPPHREGAELASLALYDSLPENMAWALDTTPVCGGRPRPTKLGTSVLAPLLLSSSSGALLGA
jgi:hypothetical protein